MRLAAETGQAAAGVDGADVRADALEQGQGAALGLDLADHVLADGQAHVGGGAGKPLAALVHQVLGDAGGLVLQRRFGLLGVAEGGDGLVDALAAHVGRGLEPVGGVELAAGELLSLEKLAHEDLAVGEGFLDDEGVTGVVLEGIADGGGLGGSLRGM